MDRRVFLGGLMALGCQGMMLKADASVLPDYASSEAGRRKKGRFDENLIVFLSDMHIQPGGHTPERFRKVVNEILAMRPLPRNVIGLGDLAHLYGREEDYRLARELFAPLEEAGIVVTHAMGNHDRRENFAKVFPEKASATRCPGYVVSVVETPFADVIVLDSLQQGEDEKDCNRPGRFDDAQCEWLRQTLKHYNKPVFIAAHHPLKEVRAEELLFEAPTCCGYIHGHDHRWRPEWVNRNWNSRQMLRTLCLPSTGFWGDIGYMCLQMSAEFATAYLAYRDFFFLNPLAPDEKKPLQWELMKEDYDGQKCRFAYERVK